MITLTCVSFSWFWWAPLVVAPAFWQLWSLFSVKDYVVSGNSRLIGDWATHIMDLLYVVMAATIISGEFSPSWVWIIGVIWGIVVVWPMGLLYPHRWSRETI